MQRFVLPGLGGVHSDSGFSDSNRHLLPRSGVCGRIPGKASVNQAFRLAIVQPWTYADVSLPTRWKAQS